MSLVYLIILAGWVPVLADASSSAENWQHLGQAMVTSSTDRVHLIVSGRSKLRVEAFNDDVIRVTLAPFGQFVPIDSWGLLDERPRGSFQLKGMDTDFITTETLTCKLKVRRRDCRLEFRDSADRLIFREGEERGISWIPIDPKAARQERNVDWRAVPVRDWIQLPAGAAVYGLGDCPGGFDRRGRAYRLWNSSLEPGVAKDGAGAQSIPFVLIGHQGRYHGLFYYSHWPITFDVGASDPGLLSFGASGGVFNYFVIPGPDPKAVVRRYTEITGRLPLPPRWALGAHQSRMGWSSADYLLESARAMASRRLACDVFYFDLQNQDGYRVFTWDQQRFGDPQRVSQSLNALGAHTLLVVQAGFKEDGNYPIFQQGDEIRAWVKRRGRAPFVGETLAGSTVYPDFSGLKVSDWWVDLLSSFLVDSGAEGVWCDRNQPEVLNGPVGTLPPEVYSKNWGQRTTHVACHNLYSVCMSQAAHAGMRQAWPDRRPLVLATASFVGGQRYAGSATVKVVRSWDDLRLSLSAVLNLGLSGIGFVGTGIDTRSQDMSAELYARWLQLNSLMPIGRAHTCWADGRTGDWSRSETLDDLARGALELRYSLMPYLYTLLEEMSRTGLPMARPVWMEFPDALDVDAERGFMLGESLYVVPVMKAGAKDIRLRLPPGRWYELGSGRRFAGGQDITVTVALETLPVFARGGAIVPMQSVTRSLGQDPAEAMVLAVWPEGSSRIELYEDDGQTRSYLEGRFRWTVLKVEAAGDTIELTLGAAKGSFVPAARSPLVRLYGLDGQVVEHVTCLSGQAVHKSDAQEAQSISRDRPVEAGSLSEPGAFAYDSQSGTWQVRLYPDGGQRQKLIVTLGK